MDALKSKAKRTLRIWRLGGFRGKSGINWFFYADLLLFTQKRIFTQPSVFTAFLNYSETRFKDAAVANAWDFDGNLGATSYSPISLH